MRRTARIRHAVVLLVLLVSLACSLVAFGAGYAVAVARLRASRPPTSDSIVALRVEPTRIPFTRLAAEGTPEWRVAMEELGSRMRRAGTRLVLFVHGSFVGDDPLALARALEATGPVFPHLARALRGFTRGQVSRLLGDLSNFPPDYVEALAAATGIEAAARAST